MSSRSAPSPGETIQTLYEFLRQHPEEVVNFEDVDRYGNMIETQCAGEHPVRELPPDLKVLCFLLKKFTQEIEESDELYAESVEVGDAIGAAKALASREANSERRITISNLLSVSVKDCFNLWDKELVYVRRGYMVVWTTEEEQLAASIPGAIFCKGSRVDS